MHHVTPNTWVVLAGTAFFALSKPAAAAEPAIAYAAPRKLADLEAVAIDESSGLAASHVRPGCFWTHNDSGDEARLYLTDRAGRDLGSCLVPDVFAFDWEDIASFEYETKAYLLAADVGNNGRSAGVQMLHLVEEPSFGTSRGPPRDARLVRTVYFSYEDDYRNCEAVAVDPRDRTVLLVSKEAGAPAVVYALAWPEPPAAGRAEKAAIARPIGRLDLPAVTSMDISPDARRAVVLTYADAYEFTRAAEEDWAAAFTRPPRRLTMPERVQGESICYGTDGRTLYLTSEKRPTPLWEVAPEAAAVDGYGHEGESE